MKTIRLSDEAYERLAAWKVAGRESFSAVILRIVPKRRTLGDLGVRMERLAPLTDEQAAAIQGAAGLAVQVYSA